MASRTRSKLPQLNSDVPPKTARVVNDAPNEYEKQREERIKLNKARLEVSFSLAEQINRRTLLRTRMVHLVH